jgi:hypothetical protein
MADSASSDSAVSTDSSKHSDAADSHGVPRWLTYGTAVVAVAALATGVAGLFFPSTSKDYSSDDTSKAKTQICTATKFVDQAVVSNTHRMNPGQKDPTGSLAVAANARLALTGGGAYLQDRLERLPATPGDLASAVGSLADTLEQLGMGYLAEAPEGVQQPLRNTLKTQIAAVNKLCS